MFAGAADVAVVDVVRARPRSADSLESLLGDEERDRVARLRHGVDRDSYATAHALLRLVVADWVGVPPESLSFGATCVTCGGPHGKPSLQGSDAPDLHVSLSRTTGKVLVAVTRFGPVGVDVEDATAVEFDGFAAVALAPAEQQAVDDLSDEQWGMGRATLWARKEAVLKATGHGLMKSPSEVEVSGPLALAALVAWHGDADGPAFVQLEDLALGAGVAGAVAVLAEEPPDVRMRSGEAVLDRS